MTILVALLEAVLLLAPAGASAQAPLQLKAGSGVGPGNPVNDALFDLAKSLDQKSGGRIKLDVVISNGLAKGEAAHLEGAQLGTIDIVPIGSAPIGGMFEAAYQALDLPFFWSSREQVWKVMDGPIGQELLKRMEAKGVKGFCFGGGWGFRNMMVNKRPITVPDDMKGLTIRVQESPAYVAFMKALGANPVPMPYVEVYLAMKQGTIDGMELPSSLAPDLQKVVADSMQQACAAHRRFEVEKEKQDLDVMKKAGTQVNEVKDLKAFQSLMKPVYAGVEQQVGKEFMDRLTAAAQAAR